MSPAIVNFRSPQSASKVGDELIISLMYRKYIECVTEELQFYVA